mmetsp:Transcript_19885/g.50038  ORF Transcript_19885/g.50038 Transcript_19885/m.50038 type:complete len:460 (+) Transcript_19885:270-1649(+)
MADTLARLLSLQRVRNGTEPGGGGDGGGESGGPQELGWLAVLTSALLIIVNITLSVRLSLGLTSKLAVAAVRCVLQLSVLGVVLEPIFDFGYHGQDGVEKGESVWWLVTLYSALMLAVAAIEASSRPALAYRWMLTHTLISMGTSVTFVLSYLLLLVVRVKPWWSAQYFIPITGMLLGNATSGVSLGLSNIIDALTTQRAQVETMLALGATRWEATQAHVHRAIITAMTPVLNQMSVVGVVSIPGMMTGQILGGQAPMQAARYQIVIMFAVLASTTIGCVGAVLLATSQLVDTAHRFRPDRISARSRQVSGMFEWLGHKTRKAGHTARLHWTRLSHRCLCCDPRQGRDPEGGWRARWQAQWEAVAGPGGGGLSGGDSHLLERDSHNMEVLSTSGGRTATEDDRDTTFFSDHMTESRSVQSAEAPPGDPRSVSLTVPLLPDAPPAGSPRHPAAQQPSPRV